MIQAQKSQTYHSPNYQIAFQFCDYEKNIIEIIEAIKHQLPFPANKKVWRILKAEDNFIEVNNKK